MGTGMTSPTDHADKKGHVHGVVRTSLDKKTSASVTSSLDRGKERGHEGDSQEGTVALIHATMRGGSTLGYPSRICKGDEIRDDRDERHRMARYAPSSRPKAHAILRMFPSLSTVISQRATLIATIRKTPCFPLKIEDPMTRVHRALSLFKRHREEGSGGLTATLSKATSLTFYRHCRTVAVEGLHARFRTGQINSKLDEDRFATGRPPGTVGYGQVFPLVPEAEQTLLRRFTKTKLTSTKTHRWME